MKRRKQKYLALLSIIAIAASSASQAALIDRGNGLIYDDVLDVTWLQDANYAQTSGYDTDGLMNWSDANTWAANLSYGNYDDWRLPTLSPVNGSTFNYEFSFDGSTDNGYNITSVNSEMAYMFYVNLGNNGFYDTLGNATGCTQCLTNTGPFQNLNTIYWSGVESTANPDEAWTFSNMHGYQGFPPKSELFYAWAVRSGDVSTVPEPAALWLIGGGLLGLLGLNRKRSSNI